MRVKCSEIINEHTKQIQASSHWLTLGKEYLVLSMEICDNEISYLLIDDSNNGVPGLHYASQFEVMSNKIPTNWKINPGTLNIFTLGPQAWEEDEFWERCYDGDLDAIKVFKREATIIMNEEDNGSYSSG